MLPLWSPVLPPNDSPHIPQYCSVSSNFPSANKWKKRKKSTAAWRMLVQMSDADVTNGYIIWSYKYRTMSTSCNDKTAHEIFQYMFNIQGNFWFELLINFLVGWNASYYRGAIVYAFFFSKKKTYITAFTLAILINRLSFPYFFYKALHFIRKMKCTTLRTEALSCAVWSCHCYNLWGKPPCRFLKSIRNAQVHCSAIHYLWNTKHAELGHI